MDILIRIINNQGCRSSEFILVGISSASKDFKDDMLNLSLLKEKCISIITVFETY